MTEPDHAALDARRRRVLYRATHRGTHENDMLIGGFVTARIATLTDAELAALEAVLEWPEVDLAEWITGRQAIPPEIETPMLRWMRGAALKTADGA